MRSSVETRYQLGRDFQAGALTVPASAWTPHGMGRPMLALGRMGKDTETASLVAYLAGPEAGFITRAALTIDGGYLA